MRTKLSPFLLLCIMGGLAKRYEITIPEDAPFFNMDDELADRAFRAAIEFLSTSGAYCISTGRVIQFTGQEVLDTLRALPAELTVGRGKDARTMRKRRIEEREAMDS